MVLEQFILSVVGDINCPMAEAKWAKSQLNRSVWAPRS